MQQTSAPTQRTAEAVERQVAHLRIALETPPGEGWLRCGDLLGEGGDLRWVIESTQAGRGAPDAQVTASLWFQSYAYRVAIPVVAPFALGLAGFAADPRSTHIRISRDRPAAVAVTDPALHDRSAEQAASDLPSLSLSPMVEAITARFTIGRRLLWGNAAASVASVLRSLEGAPGADRAAIRERGTDFFAHAEPWFGGVGHFDVVESAGRDGWYWTRTNCCLYEKCEGASRCADCSLIPASELEAARRAELAAHQEVSS